MAPSLLFGFLFAGILSILISPKTVERHLGTGTLLPVVKASLFGIPLPLCSCSVIPVTASLRRHGATRGAATSFLLSTPQTGVDSIMVTLSLLGPVFCIYRPIVAFMTGMIGGTTVALLDGGTHQSNGTADTTDDGTHACTCGAAQKKSRLIQILRYGFITLPRDIARPMLIGLFFAGIITVLVPDDFFLSIFGSGIIAMLFMMVCAIPMYVCATASIPIAAALIAKGVSPGVALVFLTTGPATNIATIITLWKTMGIQTTVIYLLTVAVSAVGFGILLDAIFTIEGISQPASMGWMLPEPVRTVSAIVLLGLLVYCIAREKFPVLKPASKKCR